MDASVGEAIEEFMQFAEGLKCQTVQGKALVGTSYGNIAIEGSACPSCDMLG